MSSVDAVRSLLSLDTVVKGVKEGDFQTDLAVDRWVRWLSVGLTLLLATILIVKDFYSGDRVFCLPTEDLDKFITGYAWAFAGNVNGYCGTNMTHVEKYRFEPVNASFQERRVVVEEEVFLSQHILPLILVVQAMICSLPFFMWSLAAGGDVQANLKFIKVDLEKHFKENIEPHMDCKGEINQPDGVPKIPQKLKKACDRWINSKQKLNVKYFLCMKFMTIFFGLVFLVFYLFCPYGQWKHISRLDFTCNIQEKMIFKCMLSTGHFVPLIWITNMLSLCSNILLGILHVIPLLAKFKGKPLVRTMFRGPRNFFEAVAGLEEPEYQEQGRQAFAYNDYELMSDLSYRNIHLMDRYYYMLGTVWKRTIRRDPPASAAEKDGEGPRFRGAKVHTDGADVELQTLPDGKETI